MRLLRSLSFAGAMAALLPVGAAAQVTAGQTQLTAESGVCPDGDSRCSYGRTWFVTIYGDRRAANGLWPVVGGVFDVGLKFRNQYFVGGALSYVLLHDIRIPIPFTGWTATHNRIEIEGQLDQHFGEASNTNTEVVLAAVFRTGNLPLFAGISMNVAFGLGPSYAFSAPDEPRDYKFLNYLSGEVEFGSEQFPALHVVPQLHHRSGVFGLIAPSAAGSTYLGVGLRLDLD